MEFKIEPNETRKKSVRKDQRREFERKCTENLKFAAKFGKLRQKKVENQSKIVKESHICAHIWLRQLVTHQKCIFLYEIMCSHSSIITESYRKLHKIECDKQLKYS